MDSQMQLASWGLIEQAKEELELLEFQHPNKFHSLKMDLKAFISDLHSQSHATSMSTCPSAPTQESSSRNKRKKVGGCESMSRRGKTDAVLDRAKQCLHKIQHFKISLYI